MKKLLAVFVTVAAAIACNGLLNNALRADDYPSRPITMISVFGPGSASDTLCRILADPLSQALGQPIVVEDRPGADGAVAAAYVHHQPADGYTLLMATNSPLSADPFLHKVDYDVMRDFAPVTRVGSFTLMLVINPKLPFHSVQELVAYAKANPGQLSFASGNTAGIVGGDTLANWAGIKLIHVPYTSTPPALEDIIAGRVSMMFADLTTAMPHVAAGTLRALAVSRIKRSSLFPDLPTMDESGLKGFNLDAWAGLVAPSGVPQSVIDKLNPVLRKIIDSPDVQKKFKNVGFEAFSSTPAELGDYIKVQLDEWQKMVKDANIQAD
ncbi:MAG TPA: tripartite tricarboxylate transporter substrate binding protein [Xanthobacteraceae bacterium]|jgi:tripartite-type tricarboxylate transporter receptor subunit TctC|nr:tripartite tricarboxylate transporter substrate binding protein [Xanthobacteraceae bacterium]